MKMLIYDRLGSQTLGQDADALTQTKKKLTLHPTLHCVALAIGITYVGQWEIFEY